MGKRKKGKHETTPFDRARDELFSQIRHCGVLEATDDQRDGWFKDTMNYMAERYPDVTPEELKELEELGRRYCRPVIPHGADHNAMTGSEQANGSSG